MNFEEHILGYDAREMAAGIDADWNDDRKSRFLISQETKKPLSTDVLVWKPVLDYDTSSKDESWIDYLRLWNDLESISRALNGLDSRRKKECWLICISLFLRSDDANGKAIWEPALPQTRPSAKKDDWKIIGYDVSDMALLSGVTNCGYDAGEIKDLRDKWSPYFNEFHLFKEISKADEFKYITDARVPEHAPFFVFGLYLIN